MTEGQHIVGSLKPFEVDSGDWPAYTERLESYFIANEIKDEKKQVAVSLTLMRTRSYNLLRSVLAPTKPEDLNFKELTTALEQHFSSEKSVISERFRLYKREQAPTESVSDYIGVLRKLSEHFKFETFSDTALRD